MVFFCTMYKTAWLIASLNVSHSDIGKDGNNKCSMDHNSQLHR